MERIIGKALEKDRELRYQHAADMRADLRRLKRETETGRVAVASSGTVAVAPDSDSQVAAPQPVQTSGSAPAVTPSSSSAAVKVTEFPIAGRRLWKVLAPAAVVLVAAFIVGEFLSQSVALRSASGSKAMDELGVVGWTYSNERTYSTRVDACGLVTR